MNAIRHAWTYSRMFLIGVMSLPLLALLIVWFGLKTMGFEPTEFLSDPWFYGVPAFATGAGVAALFRYHYCLAGRRDLMARVAAILHWAMAGMAVLALATM